MTTKVFSILNTRWVRIRVHRFDTFPGILPKHNHAEDHLSICFGGTAFEETDEDLISLGFGSIRWRSAEAFHRLFKATGKPFWTLVILGPERRKPEFRKGDFVRQVDSFDRTSDLHFLQDVLDFGTDDTVHISRVRNSAG